MRRRVSISWPSVRLCSGPVRSRPMSATGVLVGRDAELRVFERALEVVDGGRSAAVGVVGEPGIGKSRLLGELGGRALKRGHVVLAGRRRSLRATSRSRSGATRSTAIWASAGRPRSRAWRPTRWPIWRSRCRRSREWRRGRRRRRSSAIASARAVRGLVARLAASRPLTLLLDDVHWADPASADVVALLLHRPPEGAVLILETHGPSMPGELAERAGIAPRYAREWLEQAGRRRAARRRAARCGDRYAPLRARRRRRRPPAPRRRRAYTPKCRRLPPSTPATSSSGPSAKATGPTSC